MLRCCRCRCPLEFCHSESALNSDTHVTCVSEHDSVAERSPASEADTLPTDEHPSNSRHFGHTLCYFFLSTNFNARRVSRSVPSMRIDDSGTIVSPTRSLTRESRAITIGVTGTRGQALGVTRKRQSDISNELSYSISISRRNDYLKLLTGRNGGDQMCTFSCNRQVSF